MVILAALFLKMTTCSVVIITFNEEKNIEHCLKSIQLFADEIVVVDSCSTDRTKEICSKYNVRFFEQPFLGYIEQKNFALKKASHPFALCLDADEALDETLLQHLLAEKKKGFPAGAYKMNRSNFFCGRFIQHGTWYPDTKLRLVTTRFAEWQGINPHDKLETTNGVQAKHLKGNILHYTYFTVEELIQQQNRFTTIQAKAMLAQHKKANWIKLYINPLVAFVSGYFIKGGFKDGIDGLIIAKTVAYFTFLKYAKLKKLQQQRHVE